LILVSEFVFAHVLANLDDFGGPDPWTSAAHEPLRAPMPGRRIRRRASSIDSRYISSVSQLAALPARSWPGSTHHEGLENTAPPRLDFAQGHVEHQADARRQGIFKNQLWAVGLASFNYDPCARGAPWTGHFDGRHFFAHHAAMLQALVLGRTGTRSPSPVRRSLRRKDHHASGLKRAVVDGLPASFTSPYDPGADHVPATRARS